MTRTSAQFFVSVARDFSPHPGPRRRDEGLNSGEEFLETLLEPKFIEARRSSEKVVVDLDGCSGFATSFLEAVFGGLARKYGIDEVLRHTEIVSRDEPMLKDEIEAYIRDAIR
jgi:hypothetical protein